MNMEADVLKNLVKRTPKITVLVAAEGDGNGLGALLSGYRAVLDAREESYELILFYDQKSASLQTAVDGLKSDWPQLEPLSLRPWQGEDAALKLGIDRARGDIIVTLAAWPEIANESINDLIDAVGSVDIATGKRVGLERTGMQKFRASTTHGLLKLLFQQEFEDVFCRARAGRKEVFVDIAEMGVRQHFLPLIAVSQGYNVQEFPVTKVENVDLTRLYRFKPQAHVGALIDLLTLYVGLKFMKRPLRFFGAIGMPLMILGFLITTLLVFDRLFLGTPLGDRPALVFSVLTFVLGVQIVALGLVGEIIIFSSSRRMRSYEIEEIIRGRPVAPSPGADAVPEGDSPPQGHA